MSRQPRKVSQTGLYHIVFRGINRQNIFEEEKDYLKLLDLVKVLKDEREFQLYAYCYMVNHGHMLLKEKEPGDTSVIMHRLLTTYAGWYNKKYSRSGSLLGNRFASEPVEKEQYLLTLVRYIHQNPKKAGIVNKLAEYRWSSYNEYISGIGNLMNIKDTEYVLGFLSNNTEKSKELFLKLHDETVDGDFEIDYSRRPSNELVRKRIMELLNGAEPHTIGAMPREERNKFIKMLRQGERFSIRQIERATGISRGIISRI